MVWEDEAALSFLDINPITPGHALVVPRIHAASLAELEPELGAHLFRVAMHVSAALRLSALRADGVNLFLADGAAAGQDIFHVHVHVIPRFPGDGLEIRHAGTSPPRDVLDAHAARIRAAIDRAGEDI